MHLGWPTGRHCVAVLTVLLRAFAAMALVALVILARGGALPETSGAAGHGRAAATDWAPDPAAVGLAHWTPALAHAFPDCVPTGGVAGGWVPASAVVVRPADLPHRVAFAAAWRRTHRSYGATSSNPSAPPTVLALCRG